MAHGYNDSMADSHQFDSDDPRDPSRRHSGSDHSNEDAWITEEDVKALEMERDILGDDEETQAIRILKENLPTVVHAVVKLARTAQSETVRLNAAKYVIDRNLGKITEPDLGEDDILREVLEGVTVN